ncbi:sensor with HAMP domain [Paenibacillus sp. FSL R5-192]|uniref:sensor histidine kinase n=2 Tax=unclassified Paenibacillus TaxID=185978 RepID=UPI0003E21F35|nr:sensor histidine kinase [Paenibacillus sp. FSL R5-192]ETT36008.1 sensor with HAMP domain [Paenibacillus sp. FSL R5-192]PJN66511.1 putative sensor-like histidine kinase [Paenibacillus sp. GM1FR]
MPRWNLNYMKLRDKLLLMYVLSVFIPIVVTNVVFYNVTSANIRSQKTRDAGMALNNLKNDLRVTIDQGVGLSYSLYTDPVFNDTISRSFQSHFEYIDAYNSYLKGQFSGQMNQGIRWYQVYTDNSTILSSGYIDRLTDDVRNSDWYVQFQAYSAPYPALISSDQMLSLVQRLDNLDTGGREQLLKIDLNMDMIKQYFHNSGFDGKVYLLDPGGHIQFSNDPTAEAQIGKRYSEIQFPNKMIPFEITYTGINYLEGWSLHGVMDEEIVLKEVRKSRSFVVWLACINFVLPSIIIAAMSRSIHVRLVRILKHMKKVKTQNFQTIPPEDARDEIGQLTMEFNRMTETIHNLIHEVYLADIQKKDLELKQQEAQLHALHSQINPHFLFNTLESVRMRSLIKGEKETAKIVHNMAKMFRKSISWNQNDVTVKEELELIESFLQIQKYRFGEKLQYTIEADPAVLMYRIPKMVILPFVENASIHGIESSPGVGIIQLFVSMENDQLHIRLTDNGIGMSQAKLEELLSYLDQNTDMGEHVGMKNAYSRLKLCYKNHFTFDIQTWEGEGTRIQIKLPLDPSAMPGD